MALQDVKPPVIQVGGSRFDASLTPAVGEAMVMHHSSGLWTPTPVSTRKNLLHNGLLRVWQRGGTNATTITTGQNKFRADRWRFTNATDASIQMQSDTDVPTPAQCGLLLGNSLLASIPTTTDASIGASQYAGFVYTFEGRDFQPMHSRQVTLSFWAKASLGGQYSVGFVTAGANYSYVAPFTINSINTWEKKVITLTMPTVGGLTFDSTAGLQMWITLAAGASYQTASLSQWVSGAYFGTSSNVNWCGGNYAFRIAALQLEFGPVATAPEVLPWAQELAICMRYYEKSYDYGTFEGSSSINAGACCGIRANGGAYLPIYFKVPKRAAFNPTLYSPVTGTAGYARNWQTGADQAATISTNGETGCNVAVASATAQDYLGVHFGVEGDF